jgi:hypothetical protein
MYTPSNISYLTKRSHTNSIAKNALKGSMQTQLNEIILRRSPNLVSKKPFSIYSDIKTPKLSYPIISNKHYMFKLSPPNFQNNQTNRIINEVDEWVSRKSQIKFKHNRSFTKLSVLKSKVICKNCKNKLKSKAGSTIELHPKMFSKSKENIKSNSKKLNSIFKELIDLKTFILKESKIKSMSLNDVHLAKDKLGIKLIKFKELNFLLIKFLMNEQISMAEIDKLTELERSVFLLFVNKKKQSLQRIKSFNEESLRSLSKNWIKKRFEENLRFIVNKAFKFLIKTFNDHLFYTLENHMNPKYQKINWTSRFEYAFYGYYFEEVANCINKPIEVFIHPKSKKHSIENSNFVPKTISQYYLNLICTSNLFKRDLKIYLENCLINEAKHNIISKIEGMCKKWENKIATHGSKHLIQEIKEQYERNPKCKLAWGLQEVDLAKQTLKGIFSISKSN